MKRIPPAARQLVSQVTALSEDSVGLAVGEADGFGVHRSIEFDDRVATWLFSALAAIRDERIASVQQEDDKVIVTFVADTRADKRTPYPLPEVKAILDEPDETPPPVKKAAKKRATKPKSE